jgi:hypothetical protein
MNTPPLTSLKGVEVAVFFPLSNPVDSRWVTIYRETVKCLLSGNTEEMLFHFGDDDPHLYSAGVDDVLLAVPGIADARYWYPALLLHQEIKDITPSVSCTWYAKFEQPKYRLLDSNTGYDIADWLDKPPPCRLDDLIIRVSCDLSYYTIP